MSSSEDTHVDRVRELNRQVQDAVLNPNLAVSSMVMDRADDVREDMVAEFGDHRDRDISQVTDVMHVSRNNPLSYSEGAVVRGSPSIRMRRRYQSVKPKKVIRRDAQGDVIRSPVPERGPSYFDHGTRTYIPGARPGVSPRTFERHFPDVEFLGGVSDQDIANISLRMPNPVNPYRPTLYETIQTINNNPPPRDGGSSVPPSSLFAQGAFLPRIHGGRSLVGLYPSGRPRDGPFSRPSERFLPLPLETKRGLRASAREKIDLASRQRYVDKVKKVAGEYRNTKILARREDTQRIDATHRKHELLESGRRKFADALEPLSRARFVRKTKADIALGVATFEAKKKVEILQPYFDSGEMSPDEIQNYLYNVYRARGAAPVLANGLSNLMIAIDHQQVNRQKFADVVNRRTQWRNHSAATVDLVVKAMISGLRNGPLKKSARDKIAEGISAMSRDAKRSRAAARLGTMFSSSNNKRQRVAQRQAFNDRLYASLPAASAPTEPVVMDDEFMPGDEWFFNTQQFDDNEAAAGATINKAFRTYLGDKKKRADERVYDTYYPTQFQWPVKKTGETEVLHQRKRAEALHGYMHNVIIGARAGNYHLDKSKVLLWRKMGRRLRMPIERVMYVYQYKKFPNRFASFGTKQKTLTEMHKLNQKYRLTSDLKPVGRPTAGTSRSKSRNIRTFDRDMKFIKGSGARIQRLYDDGTAIDKPVLVELFKQFDQAIDRKDQYNAKLARFLRVLELQDVRPLEQLVALYATGSFSGTNNPNQQRRILAAVQKEGLDMLKE
jgi:hypothetical protein